MKRLSVVILAAIAAGFAGCSDFGTGLEKELGAELRTATTRVGNSAQTMSVVSSPVDPRYVSFRFNPDTSFYMFVVEINSGTPGYLNSLAFSADSMYNPILRFTYSSRDGEQVDSIDVRPTHTISLTATDGYGYGGIPVATDVATVLAPGTNFSFTGKFNPPLVRKLGYIANVRFQVFWERKM